MRLFIIFIASALWSCASFAQESSQIPVENMPESETPRQKIVDEITEVPEPRLLLQLRGPSESGAEIEVEVEPEIEPKPESAEDSSESAESDQTEIETANSDSELSSEPVALAPFYLSAQDYLKQRSTEQHDQLILEYEIETSSLEEAAEARVEAARLIIGPDYASIEGPKSQKIYDFKLNRFLEIKTKSTTPETPENGLIFDNVSLYAKAYRNIATVRQATQNGARRRIQISNEHEIDSFWLESSMSWAAAKLEKTLKIKSTKTNVLAIWDGMSVVSAGFSDDTYENETFKNSLFAFAHHAWPVHPNILVEFYRFDGPPKSLEMVSFGPAQPRGQKQKWTLVNRDIVSGSFPLPETALSTVERRPISPLVFVISEAVANRALGGLASLDSLETAFDQAGEGGDKLSQWLIGQRYNAYSGACETGQKNGLCETLSDLAETGKFAAIGTLDPKAKTLSDFIGATEMAKFKKSRATALFTLQPYLDDPDTPSYILRSAAMARASMKKADAAKSGIGAIQAEALLKQAIARDPYDPHTYLGLAQIYAAKGAYEQSWDIYDVLRAGIPTVGAVSLKIDQAEANLKNTGPGYFLTK